jgi:plastocyanin
MRTFVALLFSCLALMLLAAGCGGGDDEEEEAAPPPPPAAKGPTVSMKDTKFDPQSITVERGATVKWTNEDSVGHDVTKKSGPGPDFKSGSPGGLSKGDTFTRKLTTSGTYGYVCTVHPGMEGSIVVK